MIWCRDTAHNSYATRNMVLGMEYPVGQLRDHIEAIIYCALRRNGGNKSAAGRELGVSEKTIRYHIKLYPSLQELVTSSPRPEHPEA